MGHVSPKSTGQGTLTMLYVLSGGFYVVLVTSTVPCLYCDSCTFPLRWVLSDIR